MMSRDCWTRYVKPAIQRSFLLPPPSFMASSSLHPSSLFYTAPTTPTTASSHQRTSSQRPRPASRRAISAGASSTSVYHPNRQNQRPSSSSQNGQLGPHIIYRPPATPPPRGSRPMPLNLDDSPRFSRLLSSVLGSPFLTTTDLPLQPDLMDLDMLDARPASPVPSVDFSIIDVDPDETDANTRIPGAYPLQRHSMFPLATESFAWPSVPSSTTMFNRASDTPQNPFRALLPRIWDALSSPSRGVLTSAASSRSSSPTPRLGSWYLADSPAQEQSGAKGKARASLAGNASSSDISFAEISPLDDEEGELIDDEACFVDVRAVTGIGESSSHTIRLSSVTLNVKP